MQIAEAAKQLAKLSQSAQTPEDELAIWSQLERLLELDAETAQDALALLAYARQILNASSLPQDSIEGFGQHVALVLIRNAIGGLERLSGEREAAFTGHEWH